MSVEERAKDIKSRLRADMAKTLRQNGLASHSGVALQGLGDLLDELMEDALHHIEPLLLEIDGLTIGLRELDRQIRADRTGYGFGIQHVWDR